MPTQSIKIVKDTRGGLKSRETRDTMRASQKHARTLTVKSTRVKAQTPPRAADRALAAIAAEVISRAVETGILEVDVHGIVRVVKTRGKPQ